ncbi:cysteine desulfurase family protein [Actinacidiphila epipremni]|uniref:cysteine desulfurase n=1 Tax=Actinacidiphila epipremni TaxID=2053013 RepID=A0ABX0ZR92_9ACTN|nr:cysteine desulfurase family protein [Actinacidiphila epipremni]NJP45117.1 cysteine desulfurase [Actinacidiphila epipremni]
MAYFDHAATTPMLPEAVEAMTAHLTVTGNASALHAAGRRARRTVEEAREALAAALGARPSEVVFTGGGTESDNLAVKGLFWARRAADPRRVRVLSSPVEHHAVLDAVHWLADHEGAVVEWLPVDAYGRVGPDTLRAALAANPDDVALVTAMWANNEVGTILPVADLAAVCAEFGVPMHSDAVQAFGQEELDFAASGLDAMTVTGHKVGGPYGVGALLLRRDDTPVPLLHGGEQERSRSGTLDVPAIAAFAAAGTLAAERREQFTAHVGRLRDELARGVLDAVPDAVLNGDPAPGGRLATHAHFTFPGCEGDALLLLLDAQGIACSTGSACTAGVAQPSHVLLAMGQPAPHARATLRFSLGHTTTADEVAELVRAIGPAVARARTAGQT